MGGPSLSHNYGWQLKLVKLPWQLNWWSDGASALNGRATVREARNLIPEQLHTRAQVSARRPEYIRRVMYGQTGKKRLRRQRITFYYEAQGSAICD